MSGAQLRAGSTRLKTMMLSATTPAPPHLDHEPVRARAYVGVRRLGSPHTVTDPNGRQLRFTMARMTDRDHHGGWANLRVPI
jgi:hypothetical protein